MLAITFNGCVFILANNSVINFNQDLDLKKHIWNKDTEFRLKKGGKLPEPEEEQIDDARSAEIQVFKTILLPEWFLR